VKCGGAGNGNPGSAARRGRENSLGRGVTGQRHAATDAAAAQVTQHCLISRYGMSSNPRRIVCVCVCVYLVEVSHAGLAERIR
jgi:hypothetical protein